MKKVLHVGCGSATIRKMTSGFQQGWKEVRFDINPNVNPDIVGTITDMVAVPSESVDAVYSSHNVEHVHWFQVGPMLREFWRVLRPDGFLVVTCPNIQAVAEQVAKGNLTDPLYVSPIGPISAMDIMFGHVASIKRGEEYMAHRCAFTRETLIGALEEAGFPTIGSSRRGYDLWALASKVKMREDKMRLMMKEYLYRARAS